MDERPTHEQHRREVYDATSGGAFPQTPAGGALALDKYPDGVIWDSIAVALRINPNQHIVFCTHTGCQGAIDFGYLEEGLGPKEQAARLYELMDRIQAEFERRFRPQYPDFTVETHVVDIVTGKVIPRD